MLNVAVFFGGKSCEHDVSVITGVLTLNTLDKELFNPVPVFVSSSGEWFTGEVLNDVSFYKSKNYSKLKRVTFLSSSNYLYKKGVILKKLCKIDVAINCIHGLNGEDGSLAGFLKLIGVPLASPSMFGSSFAMDKDYTKTVLKGLSVETLPYLKINKKDYLKDGLNAVNLLKIKYPIIVKPANLGSSIGISTATTKEELKSALDLAFIYDTKVIIEPKLSDFTELNCSAYKSGDKVVVSEVEKPISASEILTFKDKYEIFKGGSGREFPANIDKNLRAKIKSITKKVYEKCEFNGIIRIDYIYKDKLYLNEINTVPGSLAYYLFSDTIKGFSKILTDVINQTLSDFDLYSKQNFNYASNVLKIDGVKGGKVKSFDK